MVARIPDISQPTLWIIKEGAIGLASGIHKWEKTSKGLSENRTSDSLVGRATV